MNQTKIDAVVDKLDLQSENIESLIDFVKSNDIEKVSTGYEKIDRLTGGLRFENTYLISGLEKSGKSSFIFKMITNWLKDHWKIGLINTELSGEEVLIRLAALTANKTLAEIEAKKDKLKKWIPKIEKYFFATTPGQLVNKEGQIDFDVSLSKAEAFVEAGARILIFDNLTTYGTQAGQKRGWEVLSNCVTRITNFAKQKNVLCLIVIHTKPDTVFSDTPGFIRKIIEDNEPEKMFSKSATIVRRPSLSDVYGGGGCLSQLSGAFLVWRPFQKFNDPSFKEMTLLILDSFRHSESGVDVEMVFNGSKGLLMESDNEQLYQKGREVFAGQDD